MLFINLGTPDEPTAPAIRRYLREFLSDRRVVEVPRLLWALVLWLFILPLRPAKLVHAYRSVWSEDGSPLLSHSQRQSQGLARALAERFGTDVPVALAMTYGKPSVESALDRLAADGVNRIFVFAAYPQYSATTTAAAQDAVFRVLMRRRWLPELRTLNSYHDDPAYIGALADSLRQHWAATGEPEHLLMSFHSIPRRYLDAGDPYYCFCRKTARLLAERLQLPAERWSVSFQSRLGNQPWLSPYTDVVVRELARRGVRRLDVICPGFAADCLETLEEVAIRYRDDFLAAGGQELRYVPALNDRPAHIAMLAELAAAQLQGWIPAADAPDADPAQAGRVAAAREDLRRQGLPAH